MPRKSKIPSFTRPCTAPAVVSTVVTVVIATESGLALPRDARSQGVGQLADRRLTAAQPGIGADDAPSASSGSGSRPREGGVTAHDDMTIAGRAVGAEPDGADGAELHL